MKLLTTSTKIEKSNKSNLGYLSTIMYLSPYTLAGYGNICPHASPVCANVCLNTAGMGVFSTVQKARKDRTKLFFEDRQKFKEKLVGEIEAFSRKAQKYNMKPAIRLNGTSDLNFELLMPDLFPSFPNVQFYDYTKSKARMNKFLAGKFPKNYYLVFSRSEVNEKYCKDVLKSGGNVSVVFEKIPKKYLDTKVVAGDDHDLVFLHPKGRVIGLSAKGQAKQDNRGFVVRNV